MKPKNKKNRERHPGIQLCAFEKALQKELRKGAKKENTRWLEEGCYETVPTESDW